MSGNNLFLSVPRIIFITEKERSASADPGKDNLQSLKYENDKASHLRFEILAENSLPIGIASTFLINFATSGPGSLLLRTAAQKNSGSLALFLHHHLYPGCLIIINLTSL